MIQIAQFSLFLAVACAVYAVIASIVAIKKQSPQWLTSSVHALIALAGAMSFAVFLLVYFLLSRDFRLAYVAGYVDVSLHTLYVISALWGGQEGSLLFWSWTMAVCAVVCLRNVQRITILQRYGIRRIPQELNGIDVFSRELSSTVFVFAMLLGFFLSILLVHANPFVVLLSPPLDGNGLNPLLQNPYMVMHPPLLFIGYAGFGMAFALACSALWVGKISRLWIVLMRRWVLFSWYFLGMGIILGAKWAYLELGWGGYWGWDPVENSSLLPWLMGTALLHTLILQQRKGSLVRWNLFLSIITFQLCVLGTFITRSGILESVHAYAQSETGPYFLLFLLVSLSCMAGLFFYRYRDFRHRSFPTPLVSKENSFFLTNQVFMGLSFAVLYGTTFPILAELLTGQRVVIDATFFNKVSIPLGLLILGLIGGCQALSWKQHSVKVIQRTFLVPLVLSLVVVSVLRVLGVADWLVLLTCGLGTLVVMTMLHQIQQFLRPFALFHLGLAFLIVGIAVSSTYKQKHTAELSPGESFSFDRIRFHYREKHREEGFEVGIASASIDIYRDDTFIATVTPEKRFYGDPDAPQITTEIGLYSSFKEDFYVILDGWNEHELAFFTFIINPMIRWIWIGGFGMCSLGMLLTVFSWVRTRFFL